MGERNSGEEASAYAYNNQQKKMIVHAILHNKNLNHNIKRPEILQDPKIQSLLRAFNLTDVDVLIVIRILLRTP